MTTPTKPALPEPSEPSKLLSRVLHELAGAASLCWEPKPTGVFDSQRAIGFVEQAIAELCTAIEAAVAEARTEIEELKSDIADALTTIAVYEAEARAVPEWPCACDEQGRGEPGVTCGDCPRDYGHCVTPSPTPVEQPKPAVRDDSAALDWIECRAMNGQIQIARSIMGTGYEIAVIERGAPTKVRVYLGALRDCIRAALSGEQP